MVYFIINLILHAAVSGLLLLIFFHYVRLNQERRNKKGLSYLLPTLLAAFLLVQFVGYTVPRLLDMGTVAKSTYRIAIGEVEETVFMNNSMKIDGKTYYYNPFLYKPHEGDRLEFTYAPNSKYISAMKVVEEN